MIINIIIGFVLVELSFTLGSKLFQPDGTFCMMFYGTWMTYESPERIFVKISLK